MTGFVAGFIACFVPIEALASLISLGTLMVFTFVDAGVILLRLGNVAEASYETLNFDKRVEAKATMRRNHERVVMLLLLFTISILGISFSLSISSSKLPCFFLVAVGTICGILIAYTPDSWTRKEQSIALHSHTIFECPFFPFIPLGGVALNTLLMGGLPLSSWLLCALWLTCGLVLYFNYGIIRSKLGDRSLQTLETDQLVDDKITTTVRRDDTAVLDLCNQRNCNNSR